MNKELWARFGADVATAVHAKDSAGLEAALDAIADYLILDLELAETSRNQVKYEIAVQLRNQIQGQLDGLKLMWLDFELSDPEGE